MHIGQGGRSAVLELVAKRILKGRFHGPHLKVLEARSIGAARAFEVVVIGRAKVAAILAALKFMNQRKKRERENNKQTK